jgi:NAD(P)-dependent dehydrogenase (short-subunit alcohol dehydrogenase family)
VTGAASGLGLATAELLHAGGVHLVVVDKDIEGLRGCAARLEGSIACKADITDAAAIQDVVSLAKDRFGAVHIVVNCAGIASSAKIVTNGQPHELELWTRVLDVNLTGTFNVVRIAAASMVSNLPDEETGERGVIICTASIAALDGQRGQTAYAASKAAIIGMMLPIARDLMDHAVRCNAVAPGLFDTALLEDIPQKGRRTLERALLYPHRLGRPHEFAGLVRHVIENPYINAACLRLDGGARL